MNAIRELLFALARGGSIRDAWSGAGFASEADAARALRGFAESLPGAGSPRGSSPEAERRASLPDSAGRRLVVYVDGASRGNPGPSSVGAVAYLPGGEELTSVSKAIGRATNNVAEYRAVLEGMKLAAELGAEQVEIRLDSELVARQLNGIYKIKKEELRRLALSVFEQAARFAGCRYVHVPRGENRRADSLANKALDGDASGG